MIVADVDDVVVVEVVLLLITFDLFVALTTDVDISLLISSIHRNVFNIYLLFLFFSPQIKFDFIILIFFTGKALRLKLIDVTFH